MIIGNNKPINNYNQQNMNSNRTANDYTNNNFQNKMNQIKNNGKNTFKNIFTKNIKEQHYSNVNSKSDMNDKALAMLQQRLQSGTITMEEFNKQCNALGRNSQK